ncbi:MAG: TlpA family protein disulfide reductase [Aureispira sp.]
MRTSIILSCIVALFAACNSTKNTGSAPVKSIDLTVNLGDTIKDLDSLRLFVWRGIQVEEVLVNALSKSDKGYTTTFKMGEMAHGMYYVGTGMSDLKPVLLGTEATLVLEGSSSNIAQLTIQKSPLNKEYEQMIARLRAGNERFGTLMAEYDSYKGDAAKQKEVVAKLGEEDQKDMDLLDSLRKAGSELARIMAFNAFKSYENNGVAGQSKGDYFAKTFFDEVDFTDTTYALLPFYYENVKNYSTTLTALQLNHAQQTAALDSLMRSLPEGSPLHKPTIVAAMFGMMNRNNKLFLSYGEKYLKEYEKEYPMLDKFIKQQVTRLKGPAGSGEVAAEIKGLTPEGKELSLTSLRGKYILIDFWASWCGPCRRENPNVVRMYKEYKDKGFDILSVSLDNNKDRWVQAIKQDNMTWHHISDLKGWASELSKPYGVRGIPYTVLVDPEGKILGTRLRGPALEAKLKEIFANK